MSEDKYTPKTREEIKDEVVENYDLNPETQEDTINKITDDLVKAEEGKSSAIEQKANQREKYKGILDKAGLDADQSFEKEEPIKKDLENNKKSEENKNENKNKNEGDFVTRDESRMLSEGYDWDDIETAKKIAKGSEISIKEAMGDPLFKSYLSTKEKEEKDNKSGLPPSKGSPAKGGEGNPNPSDPKEKDKFKENWSKKKDEIEANSSSKK